MLLTGKKVRLYHISFQSRDVPHPFPKWGCSISFLNVGMYHMSSQSRDVPYLFPKQDCAIFFSKQDCTVSLSKLGVYHTSSQSGEVPHLFQNQDFITIYFQHLSISSPVLTWVSAMHVPLFAHLLLISPPCKKSASLCQFGSHSSYKTTGKEDIGSDSVFWRLENSEGKRHIICNAYICNMLLVILYVYTIFYSYYKYNFKNYILLITLNIMISCE